MYISKLVIHILVLAKYYVKIYFVRTPLFANKVSSLRLHYNNTKYIILGTVGFIFL